MNTNGNQSRKYANTLLSRKSIQKSVFLEESGQKLRRYDETTANQQERTLLWNHGRRNYNAIRAEPAQSA